MSSGAPEVDPASPCVSICVLDDNDVCTGCYRSAVEITDWMMASPAKKSAILARVQKRREADGGGLFGPLE